MSDALRINLLPTREIRALRRKRREVMAGAAALLLVAGALAAGNFRQWRRADALERDLAALRRTVAALRVETKAVAPLEETVKRERLRSRAVTAWLGSRNDHSRVLRGLSAAAPDKLWLTRYGESPDATVLEGRSVDDESIARFLRGLSGTFETPALMEAGKTDGEGRDLRRFVIHGPSLRHPGLDPGSSPGQAPGSRRGGAGANDR